jgi:hypothetical protein
MSILPRGALIKIEKEVAECITEHNDEILEDLFVHSKVSTRGSKSS